MTTTVDDSAGAGAAERRQARALDGARRGAASWRFAIRLARREIRRRAGRTLLVTLLVAVPVCGMTAITVLIRTNNDSPAEVFARRFGGADLVASTGVSIDGLSGSPVPAPVGDPVNAPEALPTAALPAGSRVAHAHFSAFPMGLATTAGTARLADVTDLDLTDPVSHGIVLLRSGRFPQRAGEALLSPKLAQVFGVGVGDTLHLGTPNWTERIVGIGVRAINWNDGLLVVRGSELSATGSAARAGIASVELIDLPGTPTDAQLLQYPQGFVSRASVTTQTATRAVNWVLVGGIVALAIVGIVISGAFAVGARRQLVTLGQLSANGADERLLRRTLSLQGLLAGAIGSAAGLAAGVAILLALRGHLAEWIHHDPGAYVWSARDTVAVLVTGIVAATVAAFIPARSAARVPVLNALAGRRPLGTLPRRLVPIGAALFAGGIFVLVLVATAAGTGSVHSDALAASAVFGGLLVLAGACCASSIAVAQLGHAANRARGASRIAIRSIVRGRARSAAVVMALAAVNAGAIAIGTAIDSRTASKVRDAQVMPSDTLIVSSGGDLSGTTRQFLPPSASVTATLHKILPGGQWSVRRAVAGLGNDLPGGPVGVKNSPAPQATSRRLSPPIVTVTDPEILQLLGLSAHDTAALQRAGAIFVFPITDRNGKVADSIPVEVGTAPVHTIAAAVAHDSVHATGDSGGVFITEAKARELHLSIVDAGVIIHNPKPLDESQRASIDVLAQSPFFANAGATTTNIAWSGSQSQRVSPAEVRQIVLGIVVFIALIVLAMSLALSAAETRDERDILVSLGARPSTMRSVSAWKAALLAFSGAAVAIPTGFIPIAVVFLAMVKANETAHISFPWSASLQLLVAAPIVAGLVAYAGSAIAQTLRPTRMSTFATD